MRILSLSFSMAHNKLVAMSFMLKVLGLENVAKDIVIIQIMNGWCKEGVQKDAHRLISCLSLHQLLGVLPLLCCDEYETLLLSSAFSL